MGQRAIAVGLILFGLATLWFSCSAYWQVQQSRRDATAALKLASDVAQLEERARRDAHVVAVVLPGLHKRVVHLEEQTTALRETLLEVPTITVRVMRPLNDAVTELGVAVRDIRDEARSAHEEARSAMTAARAAFARSGAAHTVASEARDIATIAYNSEAASICAKLFEELVVAQKNHNSLVADMQRIRELSRDRRALSNDYDALFVQSLHLECAMLQHAMMYNAIAQELGAEFMQRHGLPSAIATTEDKVK